MSRGLFNSILDWADDDGSPIDQITLLGGEFALHPDAVDMVKDVRDRDFGVRIVTNGSREFRDLIGDTEVADILRDPNYENLVAVSLDDLDPEKNDAHRGKGAYKNAIMTMMHLKDKEIPFRINSTLVLEGDPGTEDENPDAIDNIPDLQEMFLFAANVVGAKGVNIHTLSTVGRGRKFSVYRRLWTLDVLESVKMGREQFPDLDIQVELGYPGTGMPGEHLGACAVRDRTNLQFCPPTGEHEISPVVACGLMMDQPDKSAYIFSGGKLYRRQRASELTITAQVTEGCPLPDNLGLLCIYDRME